jgi:hypothetical protein
MAHPAERHAVEQAWDAARVFAFRMPQQDEHAVTLGMPSDRLHDIGRVVYLDLTLFEAQELMAMVRAAVGGEL